ncbi:trafficking protein particle complex 1 [Venturia nashicola]|uniref:Trafficking protein particle complex subunit n=1 Tax=Venturia nashicola TaxID=86259 RepID=A0A4Z1PDF3_9PEZI|nr:trafficking protein particle complex 1 [Venturia nashicola]TLD29858.1 trafficking protein particle complex 1 [Venturia nashicola]
MVVYSFHIFDRHTECVYSRRWTPRPISSSTKGQRPQSDISTVSNNDTVVGGRKALSREDDAKLIFGVVFSLRNIVRNIGGEDNSFISYRTAEYKLHYYETPTKMKFVMVTDTKTSNLRVALHQIWANLFVEYVVKNPLSPIEHSGGVGVANELFEQALERFVATVLA